MLENADSSARRTTTRDDSSDPELRTTSDTADSLDQRSRFLAGRVFLSIGAVAFVNGNVLEIRPFYRRCSNSIIVSAARIQ